MALDDVVGRWITDSMDYYLTGDADNKPQMHLASLTTAAVSVSVAFWLFGSALLGFICLYEKNPCPGSL